MPSTDHPLPTEEEVRKLFDACSNWGRWGADDNRGTVNLITDEKRRQAAGLVRSGRAVSLAFQWNTKPGPANPNPVQHFMRIVEGACSDYLGISYHGFSTTHLDALCHIFWEGKMYGGRPKELVTTSGARAGSVDAFSGGIVTRGVLIDITKFRGVPYVTIDNPVRGWELEAAAEQQGVEVQPGDAVVVRSGRVAYFADHPDRVPGHPPLPGLQVDVCPVLHKWDAGILVWDMSDQRPSGYPMFDRIGYSPVHVGTLVFMGMPLLDGASLEALATACQEEGRWEFMLNIAPMNVRGATGSPVNPIAIF